MLEDVDEVVPLWLDDELDVLLVDFEVGTELVEELEDEVLLVETLLVLDVEEDLVVMLVLTLLELELELEIEIVLELEVGMMLWLELELEVKIELEDELLLVLGMLVVTPLEVDGVLIAAEVV